MSAGDPKPEHVLVIEARRRSGDPAQHAQVAVAVATVERAVAAALSVVDPDVAREVLPAVLRELYRTIQPLIAGGLINGSAWRTSQHARLFAHAVTLFKADAEHVVQRADELMPATTRPPGTFLPR